jgi:pSer/pThr/pTyr-binding forkhead associated (FHA) protein
LITLEVLSGPSRGAKIALVIGQSVIVGRTIRAGLDLHHDPYLSGRHFLVECSGDALRLRDLESTNGTFLNKERVEQAVLADGDVIVAGQTVFGVAINNVPPTRQVNTSFNHAGSPAPPPVSALGSSIRDRVKNDDLTQMAQAEDTEQIPLDQLDLRPTDKESRAR